MYIYSYLFADNAKTIKSCTNRQVIIIIVEIFLIYMLLTPPRTFITVILYFAICFADISIIMRNSILKI